MGKGNEGVARFTRPCPFCGRPILEGEPIGRTRMGWVHANCVIRVHRHISEQKRLDAEYAEVAAE